MTMFSAIDIASSGLSAQRMRMDVIAGNIANVNTTRTEEGGPYIRKRTIMETKGKEMEFFWYLPPWKQAPVPSGPGKGVQIAEVKEETVEPFKLVYDPSHPDANNEGYVLLPNVNVVEEMVDMITASRAYEANVSTIKAKGKMDAAAIQIGKA